VTYGDMMSLLLVFFIAMAAYSTMDVVKYRSLVGSIQEAFGTRDHAPGEPRLDSAPSEGIASAGAENERREIESTLEEQLRESGGPLQVLRTNDGMRLRLEGRIAFEPGETELREESWAHLAPIAPLLARYPYRIWVEGHTDDIPMASAVYPSNWELSAARAGGVVRALITRGKVPAGRLVALGYAETRPIASNGEESGRARNRRVEFLLSRPTSRAPVRLTEVETGPILP